MKKLLLLLLFAGLLNTGSVFGWGREGHETIAKIAERNLTKKAKKRIAWLVDTERFRVEALEQSSKGEDWTAGRAISLKRLHEESETLDWLTEQDRSVLATLRWSRSWNGTTCEADPYRALPALAGHRRTACPSRWPANLWNWSCGRSATGTALRSRGGCRAGKCSAWKQPRDPIFSIIFRDVWKAPPICLESMG